MKTTKLIFITAIVCALTLCAALLVGCSPALPTPEGFRYNERTITWNAVEGAEGYMIHANDAKEFYVESASVSVDNPDFNGGLVDNETNVLWVKAVTLDDKNDVKNSSELAKFEFDYVNVAKTTCTVTLNLNFTGSKAEKIPVVIGENMDKPADPQRFGYIFAGWYLDRLCYYAVNFTQDGKTDFAVNVNTTLYAKWTADTSVTKTAIYFYSDSWLKVKVKPYNGETQLFDGKGLEMSAIAGMANWYKTEISDKATSVIFTNDIVSTDSLSFDKTKPYCKDNLWTAAAPIDGDAEAKQTVIIKVGDGEPLQLSENPETPGEYIITLTLNVDDTVVITIDGVAVSNYDAHCNFAGTATMQGKHSFYVSESKIWVTAPYDPNAPEIPDDPDDPIVGESVLLIINDDEKNAVVMRRDSDPGYSDEQHSITVTLKEGDVVKIIEGDFEYTEYENASEFDGTAKADGQYTFYAKKNKDGSHSIYVSVKIDNPNPDAPTTATTVYFYNASKWARVYLYCWNYKTEDKKATWPGTQMKALGDGWYVLENVEVGYDKIIFNNGSGGAGNQTDDLNFVAESNGCAYYDQSGVTDKRPVAEENPEQPEEPLPEEPLPEEQPTDEQA